MTEEERSNNERVVLKVLEDTVRRKYWISIQKGLKVFLEDLAQLFILLSGVYKCSIFSNLIMLFLIVYLIKRKVKIFLILVYAFGILTVLQYGLFVSNLTSETNPMVFPSPFNPYPNENEPFSKYLIPWYTDVSFFNQDVQVDLYFAIGISDSKLNGLWFDFVSLCIMVTVFLYYESCILD